MQQHDVLPLELARIRWQAEGGLSGFRNLDMVDGYDCARLCLQGIIEALDRIDCANESTLKDRGSAVERRTWGERHT